MYKFECSSIIVINAMISLLGWRVNVYLIYGGECFYKLSRITLCDTNYSNSIINEIIIQVNHYRSYME